MNPWAEMACPALWLLHITTPHWHTITIQYVTQSKQTNNVEDFTLPDQNTPQHLS